MEQDFLEQTNGRDIDLFVCTDAEAILGIGDQGVGVRRPVPRNRPSACADLFSRALAYARRGLIAMTLQ